MDALLITHFVRLDTWPTLHQRERYALARDNDRLLLEYQHVRVSDALAAWLRERWSQHVVPREHLQPWIVASPHADLVPAIRGLVRGGVRRLDWEAWLAVEPTLRGEWVELVSQNAGRFNTPGVALHEALAWARHLDGGEEAWAAFARCLKRTSRRNDPAYDEALHVFTCHRWLTLEERDEVLRAASRFCDDDEMLRLRFLV